MTDFIPFGTPPGSTGNPKSIIADEFQVNQKIKVKATGQVTGDTNGDPINPSITVEDETAIIDPHIPDTRPFYLSTFGSTEDESIWGVSSQNWRKTPQTSDPDSSFTNSTTNGRLKYYETGGFQDAAAQGIARYMVANSGGFFVQGDTWASSPWNDALEDQTYGLKGYNCNSWTLMNAPYARSYVSSDSVNHPLLVQAFQATEPGREADGNMDGTDIDDWITDDPNDPNFVPEWWLATPFTNDGTTTGTPGDSRKCWSFANQELISWVQASIGENPEILHQWDWTPVYAYLDGDKTDPNTKVNLTGGYDRLTGSVEPAPSKATDGAIRSVKPSIANNYPFDNNFWSVEIDGMEALGFTGMSWGVSGNSWEEGNNTQFFADQVKTYYPGREFIFEAIPLRSDGVGANKQYCPHGTSVVGGEGPASPVTGLPDNRYRAAAHWAFMPQFFGSTSNGFMDITIQRDIDHIYFSPEVHEMHCVMDINELLFKAVGARLSTEEELYALFDHVWARGYIISLSNMNRNGSQPRIEQIQRIAAYVQALNDWTINGDNHESVVPAGTGGNTYDTLYTPSNGGTPAGTRTITRPRDPAATFYV